MPRPTSGPPPSAPDRRQALARDGERAAERALRRAGLTILERRFRVRMGEIDLIASKGDLLVFVEVKTRRATRYGPPAHAVTALKRRRMARVAELYLQRKRQGNRPCRFDVVEVFAGPAGIERVVHLPDAFRIWPTG